RCGAKRVVGLMLVQLLASVSVALQTHRAGLDQPRHQRSVTTQLQRIMNSKFILLVEDNPDDELLIVRALRKNQIWNDVEVVRDGVAALDFLFATGPCCGRDPGDLP